MKTSPLYILFLLLLFALAAAPGFAQQPEKQLVYSHSVGISSPTTISIDRRGSVYLLGPRRNLYTLDSLGRAVFTYSPPAHSRPTTIEAWNPMKVFVFYGDKQEILLLDRFLRPITSASLTDFDFPGTVTAATLASDDSFWLFSETNFTLSKLDLRYQKLTVETPIGLILDKERFDIRLLREYQNMLYLLDTNGGIFVFDNLGNYKTKLPFTGLSYINFLGNELYFVKDGQLIFYDLYKQQTRSITLPPTPAYVSALVADRHIYLFTKDKMDAYLLQ
ncbi:hypothetical protein [Botryobacter ruber]|uniref:hypothetical protein n=1 Tax=Botryobacter ruber TaxID=2171629 RepID=UPI000E0B7C2E|nr:hypothetical protein [Botryobacter ruber]